MKRILITAAAGAVGSVLRTAYRGTCLLRLSDDACQLFTWISRRDTVQLVARCIDHPDHHFAVVYGVSYDPRYRWDDGKTQFHGALFTPMDIGDDSGKID